MVTIPAPPYEAARAQTSVRNFSRTLWSALAGMITISAVLFRWHAIAAKSIWVDEGISIAIARLGWSQFFQVLWRREANMTLYYLLLHLWMTFGSSEAYVRALSVIFSVAVVPLFYALGARLFGRGTGMLAAWLLAVNAYHIRYAQEARSYSLVVFLAVLATWLLVRNIARPAEARWGIYSVVAALAVYAQFFGLLLIAAHAASLLLMPRDRETPWRDFGRSARWIGLAILPIVAVMLRIGSASSAWLTFPSWSYLSGFFESLAGNRGIVLAAFDAVALAIGGVTAWHEWRQPRAGLRSWGYALIFCWLFVPLGIVLAVSVWRPIFLARYLIFCLPALLLGVAAGVARLRHAALAWGFAIVLTVLSIQGTASYYRRDFDISRDDWRDATGYILDHAQPGDGIFFSTFGRMPYEYYKSERAFAGATPEVINWPGRESLAPDDFAVRPVAEMLRDARPAPDRVWLVLFLDHTITGQVNPTSTMLRAWYGKDRQLIAEQQFPEITVLLFAKRVVIADRTAASTN